MGDASTKPDITVVVAVDQRRDRGALALETILAQQSPPLLEALIMDRGADRFPPLQGAGHANVRTVPIKPDCGYGEMAARAVAEARAPVVAFVEEHVTVFPHWAAAIARAHEGPWAAVCGELHTTSLETPAAALIELISRQRWSAPAQRGETDVLRWQNVAYKRAALERYGDHLPALMQSESALFRRLRADGERLYIDPDAKATHAPDASWQAFLEGTYYSSRISAASAARVSGTLSPAGLRLLVSALTGPLRWPLVLLRRTRELPDADDWTTVYWRNLGSVMRYYLTASTAAIVGILRGPGDSAARFLDCEINHERIAPELDRRPREGADAA